MNPQRLALLFLILVLLGAGTWWWSLSLDARADEPPVVMSEDPLLPGRYEDLRSVTIHDPAREAIVRVVRGERPGEGDAWRLTEPLEDRVEPAAVRNMLAVLFGSDWRDAPQDWSGLSDETLGLRPSRLTVEAEFADGSISELRIGAPDVSEDHHAARLDGRLMQVGVGVLRVLQRSDPEWRDHRLLAHPESVEKVEWLPQEVEGLSFVRRAGVWRLESPIDAPLNQMAQHALARLLGARIRELPEELVTPSQRELMLDGARLRFSGSRGVETFYFVGGTLFNEERPFLLTMSGDDFRLLRYAPEEMRSSVLLDFVPSEIVSLRVTRDGGQPVDFRRRRSGWYGPDGALLDETGQVTLNQLVDLVATQEARETVPRPAAPPTGSLLLSRSARPVERGSAQLVWWVQEVGYPIGAASEGGEATRLGFNVDEGVKGLLARYSQ